MKKYYFALIIFFILIYVMPNLMTGILPNEAEMAMEAYCAYKYESFSLANIDNIISGFFISLFGFTKWGIASNGVIALIVLSVSTIYVIKKCTNDYTLAACTYLFFFSSFWIFLFIPDSVIGNSGIWGALINFAGLGAYFMASREERFSVQRISLLFLCGVLTFASLLISGLNPFFFSIIVVGIYMCTQKRYIDMVLMPLEIIFVTGGLLSITSYLGGDSWFAWVLEGKTSILTYWDNFFNNTSLVKLTINKNLIFLGYGVLPITPFLLCSLSNYKTNLREFLKRPIYKFSLIFLLTAIVFSVLNRGLTMANLPITYLPFSFLTATGFVNYLRTNNRHRHLMIYSMLIGVAVVLVGVNLLLMNQGLWVMGIAITISGLLLVLTLKCKTEERIALYFFDLSLVVIAVAFVTTSHISEHYPSSWQVRKRVEAIVGKKYPENQVQFFAHELKNYHLLNFYFGNKIELIDDEYAGQIINSKKVISVEEFKNILKNNNKEIIVFNQSSLTAPSDSPFAECGKGLFYKNLGLYYFNK
jgi:hypothetical protein